jgi:hypothetical protein
VVSLSKPSRKWIAIPFGTSLCDPAPCLTHGITKPSADKVSTALSELGLKCPPSDVGMVIAGQVLQASFIWEKGKPSILTLWSDGRNQRTRMCWIGN